ALVECCWRPAPASCSRAERTHVTIAPEDLLSKYDHKLQQFSEYFAQSSTGKFLQEILEDLARHPATKFGVGINSAAALRQPVYYPQRIPITRGKELCNPLSDPAKAYLIILAQLAGNTIYGLLAGLPLPQISPAFCGKRQDFGSSLSISRRYGQASLGSSLTLPCCTSLFLLTYSARSLKTPRNESLLREIDGEVKPLLSRTECVPGHAPGTSSASSALGSCPEVSCRFVRLSSFLLHSEKDSDLRSCFTFLEPPSTRLVRADLQTCDPASTFYIPTQLRLDTWETYVALSSKKPLIAVTTQVFPEARFAVWALLTYVFAYLRQKYEQGTPGVSDSRFDPELVSREVREQWRRLTSQ
ncbi:transmembrane protein, partial [Cystoisospora suis]